MNLIMRTKSASYLFAFLFSLNLLNAQMQGVAEYSVQVINDKDNFMQQSLLNDFLGLEDIIHELVFQLVFDHQNSFFVLKDKEYSREEYLIGAKLAVGATTNLLKNEFGILSDFPSFTPFVDEKWVPEELREYSFEIKEETKQIKGYTVNKAILYYEVGNKKKGYHKKEAIAWFCSDIPVPHGPLAFGDLPGLILELETSQANFSLLDIEFKEVNLPKIIETEIISKEDLRKKMKEQKF